MSFLDKFKKIIEVLNKSDKDTEAKAAALKNKYKNSPATSTSYGDDLPKTPSSAKNFVNKIKEIKENNKNALKKGDDEVKAMLDAMRKPKAMKPGSTDEKIKAALERQNGTNLGAKPNLSAAGSGPSNQYKDRVAHIKSSLSKINQKMSEMRDADTPNAHAKLLDSYKKNKPVANLILDLQNKGHNEPYFGDDHNLAWNDKKHSTLNQQFPAKTIEHGGVIGKGVSDGSGPDPLSWLDAKYGSTKEAMKQSAGKPLDIHTRSDLIAHDDYIQHLDKKNHKVFIHLPTSNSQVSKIIEPGNPSVKRRIAAANKLADLGHNVTLVHDHLHTPEGQNFGDALSFNRFSHPDLSPKVKTSVNKVTVSDGNKIQGMLGIKPAAPELQPEVNPSVKTPLRVVKSDSELQKGYSKDEHGNLVYKKDTATSTPAATISYGKQGIDKIDVVPGAKPVDNWKKDWANKPQQDKSDFKAKLANQRATGQKQEAPTQTKTAIEQIKDKQKANKSSEMDLPPPAQPPLTKDSQPSNKLSCMRKCMETLKKTKWEPTLDY